MNINLFVVVTVVAEWLPGETWRVLIISTVPEFDFYLGGGVRPYSRIDPIRYIPRRLGQDKFINNTYLSRLRVINFLILILCVLLFQIDNSHVWVWHCCIFFQRSCTSFPGILLYKRSSVIYIMLIEIVGMHEYVFIGIL